MNVDFQNKMCNAVRQGIQLGIELYDDSVQHLEQDLQYNNTNDKRFIAFNPFKDIDKKVIEFLNGKKFYNDFFKNLCIKYVDEYYGIYKIKNDTNLLHNLIEILCETFGNEINLNWIDVSQITDLNYFDVDEENKYGLFEYSEFNGDISRWDVSNVKNMRSLFHCSSFNGDISHWDVSNVEDMMGMFYISNFNSTISQWDVSNVKNMQLMFACSKFDKNISKWDVSNVSDMSYMFSNSIFNQDLSQWDVSNVERMDRMFENSKFNQDISTWKCNFLI